MAGAVGAGGLGNLAITRGYNRFQNGRHHHGDTDHFNFGLFFRQLSAISVG